jgi:hypothetical protein
VVQLLLWRTVHSTLSFEHTLARVLACSRARVLTCSYRISSRCSHHNIARLHGRYGPNGVGCKHGAEVDGDPMDGHYECDCSDTDYTGDNCDVRRSRDGSMATAVGWTVLGLVVGALLLLPSQYRMYRERNLPEDFNAVQDALLGMGTTMSVLPNQAGFMLQLNKAFDCLTEDDICRAESAVLHAARRLEGLPPLLASILCHEAAKVRLASKAANALLIGPLQDTLQNGQLEEFALALSEHAGV